MRAVPCIWILLLPHSVHVLYIPAISIGTSSNLSLASACIAHYT